MTTRAVKRKAAEDLAIETLAKAKVRRVPVPVDAIIQSHGLRVVYEALPNDTSSVLLLQPDGQRLIGINSRHSATRQRFSLAHELGHALMHVKDRPPRSSEAMVSRPLQVLFRDGLASQGTSTKEIEANTFAAALLMPHDMVRERFESSWRQDPSRDVDDVIDSLADEYAVSHQAMRYRLVNLDLIDPT